MKKCPECLNEVVDAAVACKYCGHKFVNQQAIENKKSKNFDDKRVLKFLSILIGSVLLLCSIAFLISRTGNRSGAIPTARPTSRPTVYIPSTTDASYMCQKFVEDRLKAPSTAKFQRFYQSTAVAMANNIFQIISYVDSENSFGAMIRTDFVCKIQYVGNDQWELVDLTTSP